MSLNRHANRRELRDRRRSLRSMQTQAEKTLWSALRRDNLGVNFRRQHSKGNFIVDFFCPQLNLAIEVDGATHDGDEAKRHDDWRQKILESEGLTFLRFTDEDILQETHRSIAIIEAKIKELGMLNDGIAAGPKR